MILREQILALRAQGSTYNAIVAELGCAKSTVSYYCGQDQSEKSSTRQRDRRNRLRKIIDSQKTGRLCMDCQVEYPPYVMDFDHRPGETKSFNVSQVQANFTEEELWLEIAKCDIVCSNCHRVRTWSRLKK